MVYKGVHEVTILILLSRSLRMKNTSFVVNETTLPSASLQTQQHILEQLDGFSDIEKSSLLAVFWSLRIEVAQQTQQCLSKAQASAARGVLNS